MYYNKYFVFSNGVLIITSLVSTAENVYDEAIQEDEHMSMSETTPLASTTKAGKEHSTVVFINNPLAIIITKNINLTFLFLF